MTYNDKIGQSKAAPWAELYTIQVGTTVYYYTSYFEDVTFENQVYTARPIRRSGEQSKDELRPDQIRVELPLTELTLAYVANSIVEDVLFTIVRVFLDGSGDKKLMFKGELSDITIKENVASVVLEAQTEIFRSNFPPLVWQSPCQWMLFDSETCGLFEEDFRVDGVVTLTNNGTHLTSLAFGAFTDGYFALGHCRFQNDIRPITDHVGNRITIFPAFDSRLTDGKTVRAYPGCDKLFQTCDVKYANTARFSGQRFIPTNNPAITGFK